MKMDYTPLGVVFTDYHLIDVGAEPFELEHDYFVKQAPLVIRTGPGGSGTTLNEGTDYLLSGEDTRLSDLVTEARGGSGCNAMRYVQIINIAFQSGDLYFSGDYVADSNEGGDTQRKGYHSVAASYTMDPDENYKTYGATCGASELTITLNMEEGDVCTFEKVDAGAGELALDGNGEDFLFSGVSWATIYVGKQYQHVTVEKTPNGYAIRDGVVQPVALEPDIGSGWHIHKETIVNVADLATADPVAVTVTNVPDGTRLISGYYSFNGGSANATLGILDYADEAIWDKNILANGGYGSWMHFEIALDTSKRFKYQGSATSITTVGVYMRKYCLGPA